MNPGDTFVPGEHTADACPSGACCGIGTCALLSQSECNGTLVALGNFLGFGTSCGDCPRPCCLPDGGCDDLTLSECTEVNGTFQSSAATCLDACAGTCCSGGGASWPTLEANCMDAGDVFVPGEFTHEACPGACCRADGSCSAVADSACDPDTSVFLGLGSVCGDCPGACVSDSIHNVGCGSIFPSGVSEPHLVPGPGGQSGDCTQLSVTGCIEQGGAFLGVAVTCADVSGACCLDEGCVEGTRPIACAASGGRFQGMGTSCEVGACQGACCVFSSGCTDQILACNCRQELGGVYQGDGTQCSDDAIACTSGRGACCLPPSFGQPCLDSITRLTCGLASGTFQGDGTSCTAALCPSGPCPGLGDCCAPNGSPGCDDQSCCERVCEAEPRCCFPSLLTSRSPEWDEICVQQARRLCGDTTGSCGNTCPGVGDCFAANGSGGCEDGSCCKTVCAVDPYCCSGEWDAVCATEAAVLCNDACCNRFGDADGDGRVDLSDYKRFVEEFDGP